MAVSRLQQWVIILSSYDYDVKYQPSTLHGNTDGLSHLPLQEEPLEQDDSREIVSALEEYQFQSLLIPPGIRHYSGHFQGSYLVTSLQLH